MARTFRQRHRGVGPETAHSLGRIGECPLENSHPGPWPWIPHDGWPVYPPGYGRQDTPDPVGVVPGKTFVYQATPNAFKLVSTGQLGDEAYASPAICGGRIYQRVAHHDTQRQEMLYCIGE